MLCCVCCAVLCCASGSVTASNVFNQPGLQATLTGTPTLTGGSATIAGASLTMDYITPYTRVRYAHTSMDDITPCAWPLHCVMSMHGLAWGWPGPGAGLGILLRPCMYYSYHHKAFASQSHLHEVCCLCSQPKNMFTSYRSLDFDVITGLLRAPQTP
jgi:hypothetical protein